MGIEEKQVMTRTMQLIRCSAGALALGLALGACGPKPPPVVEEVFIPPDIPGVTPAAVSAFYEGIEALDEEPTNYVAALDAFERAYALDEDFWEALENQGLVLMDLGRYAEAVEVFRTEATKIDELIDRGWPVQPRPELHLSIGKALAMAGRTNEAAQEFAALLQIDPGNVEATANLAALMYRTGNAEAARTYVDELLVASRNDPGALNVIALVAKQEGDMALATYLWGKALESIDSTGEAIASDNEVIAAALEGEGAVAALSEEQQLTYLQRFDELTPEQLELVRINNGHRLDRLEKVRSDIHNELGIVRLAEEDSDAAEVLFRMAVEANPTNYAAHLNLATVYLDFAAFDRACVHYQEALALRPRDLSGLIGYATCTYGTGDIDGAYAAFEHAFDEYPANEYLARRLGDIAYEDRAEMSVAREWYVRNAELRGVSCASSPDDDICRRVTSIDQIMQMQQGN